MSVDIRKNDIEIFNNNGISTEDIRNTINLYRKKGVSDEEIQQKFQAKLQEFNTPKTAEEEQSQQPQQTQETSDEYSGPSYVTGATRELVSGLTLSATPYIAGVTNIPASYLAGRFRNPIELFKEGKKEYKEEQEKFGEAYPKTATAFNLLGSIPTYIVGAGGASAAVRGSKLLANAPKAVKTLATSVGAMQPIAVQKGIEESLQEDSTIGSIAKATGVGEIEAVALGATFGGLNPLESKVIATASKMTGQTKPFTQWLAKQAVKTPFMAAEGVAIGAIPATTEGRLPTGEEIASGIIATGALRGVGAAASKAGAGVRKFLTEPTAKQKADLRAKYEINSQIQQGENRIKEIQEEIKTAKEEGKPITDLRKEAKDLKYQNRYLAAESEAIDTGLRRRGGFQEATEEEVQAYLKDHPTTNEPTARKIISDAKTKASILEQKPQKETSFLDRAKSALVTRVEKIRTTFDQLRPIKEGERNYEIATGKKIPENLKPSNKLEDYNTGGEVDVRISETIDKLKALQKADKDIQTKADVYMQAKKKVDFTPKKATQLDKDIVDQATDEVKEYAKVIYDANKVYLKFLRDSGLIDKKFYQELATRDYVPSVKDQVVEKIEGKEGMGSIADVIKRYGGEAPFYKETTEASLRQGKRIENFKLMQDAKKQYLEYATQMGEAKKVGVEKFDADKHIVVWRDGKKEIYEVPEQIAKIFNPKPLEEETAIKKVARTVQQSFKAATTGLPWGFAARNIVRDPQAAKASKYGAYITPDLMAESASIMLGKDALKRADVKEVQRAIGSRGTQTVSQIQDTQQRDILDKFFDKGMGKAYPENSAGNKLMQNISQFLQDNGKKLAKVTPKVWQKFLEGASYAGEKSEMITRYANWKAVLEGNAKNEAELAKWLSNPELIPPEIRAEARKEAREATLNFTRKMSPFIEKANRYWVPYLKPSLLGSMRLWETLTNPEISPQAWKFIANLGALEAQYKMGKMSEEDKKLYKQLARDEKTNYFEYVKDGKLRRIPLGQEHAQLVKLASIGVQRFLSPNDREQLWKEAKEDLLQGGLNASIIGQTFGSGNATPQVIKPVAEVILNKDFFTKADIESKAMRTRPKEERFTETTTDTAKALNKIMPFLSPRQIDHLMFGYGSSAGKESITVFEGLADELRPMITGEVKVSPKNLDKNNPFVKAFVPNLDSQRNQIAIDANEIIDRVKQSHYVLSRPTKADKLSEKVLERYELDDEIYSDIQSLVNSIANVRQQKNDIFSDAEDKTQELNKKIKEGKITRQQGKSIARTWSIKYRKEMESLNKEEREYYEEIIDIEKEIKEDKKKQKNTPK